jgi:hypothetical protein
LKVELGKILMPYGPKNVEINNLKEMIAQMPEPTYIKSIEIIQILHDEFNKLSRIQSNTIGDGTGANPQYVFEQIRKVMPPYIKQIDLLNDNVKKVQISYNKGYIPILRGLRPLQLVGQAAVFDNSQDNYRLRIERDYQISEKHEVSLHTGLNMYKKRNRTFIGRT